MSPTVCIAFMPETRVKCRIGLWFLDSPTASVIFLLPGLHHTAPWALTELSLIPYLFIAMCMPGIFPGALAFLSFVAPAMCVIKPGTQHTQQIFLK